MIGIIIAVIVAALILFGVVPLFILTYILYSVLLVRTKPDKWGRICSFPEDPEYQGMFDIGMAWGERYEDKKTPVDITSDGFHLFGEYFDFGGDKAVIIIAGRTESCLYGYYFAEPYRQMGYNVLVIDNRAHGWSEGKYDCLGYTEYHDILAWGKLLHDRFLNKSVVLHGICIGSSTALFALTAKDCPDYMTAMVAEGMYKNFYESYVNHVKEQGRPDKPFTQMVMLWIRLKSHADVVHDGPFVRIKDMTKPILFLHSKEDIYSMPDLAEDLYQACPSKNKSIVWFPHGAHSRIRPVDTAGYDGAVIKFFEGIEGV